MSRAVKGIIAAVVVVVVVGGGFLVWDRAFRDKSEPTADVDAIGTPPGSTPEGGSGAGDRATPDGAWTLQAGDDVFVGYRVGEVLAGVQKTANGRTRAVTGTMTIAGGQASAVEITADMTQLRSDEARRDNAIANQGLETATFPDGSFTLTSPIDFGNPQPGATVSVTATGDLTLHGVTRPVEIPLEARWSGNQIAVATVGDGYRVEFADFGMSAIDRAGFVRTEDHGTIEMQLLFVPA